MRDSPPPAAHILSFAQTLASGGVERVLLRLAGGWLEQGRRVTLMVGDPTGPLAAELPAGVTVVDGGGASYAGLLASARRVDALAPDLIFCPGNHYTAVAALARPFTRAPIVGKLSNAVGGIHRPPLAWGYAAWLRLHGTFLDHLVTMSPAMAAQAGRAMRLPAERISVIPNPPTRPISNAPAVTLPAGRFVLGVGRLARQKRWDRLIAALPHLADRAVALVLLGDGPERAALAAQAERLGVGDRVHLLGHAADPLPAMAKAAVLALTSDHEGVPNVLREAIGEGTPVVATDSSPAIAELIPSPAIGSIVARDDGATLVAALDHWLDRDTSRPVRPAAPTDDAAASYLALFDRLVAERIHRS